MAILLLGYQVRIFERSGAGWTERLGIPVPNGAISPTAPIPVALDGDTLALGTTTAANVYLRSAGNWTVQQSVVPSDMASLTRFGHALALSGNTLAVAGASTTNTAVYVFVRSGSVWAQEQKILLPPGTVPAGGSVPLARDGDTLLVGAPADGAAGRVFAYQRSGSVWALQQTLLAYDSSNGQAFGFSLALENDKAAIGAATERAVYVFTRSSGLWSEQEKFIPPSGG